MTFQQLLYVSEVAQLGSINKAAKMLYISQSTVSNAIKDLEKELQFQIFQRSTVGIQLTMEGKEFLNYARSLIDQKNHVEKLFKKTDVKHFSRLTVASQHLALSVRSMAALVNSLEDENYEVCIKELPISDLLTDVCTDTSDVGVVIASDIMRHFMDDLLASKDLEFHEICRIHPHVTLRNDHPLAQKERVCKADLAPYPYLGMYQDYTTPFDHSEEVRLFSQHRPDRVIYVTDRASLYDMLCTTDAYHFSTGMQTPWERTYTKVLPVSGLGEEMRFGWVKLRHKELTTEAKQFIDHLTRLVLQHVERHHGTNLS